MPQRIPSQGGVTPHGFLTLTCVTLEHMNAPACPNTPCFSLSHQLDDLKAFARREPIQAMAIAVGAGLLINLLPKRAVVGTATTLGSALLHPALLALGLTKALELCCRNSSSLGPPDEKALSLTHRPDSADVSASSRPSQWLKP